MGASVGPPPESLPPQATNVSVTRIMAIRMSSPGPLTVGRTSADELHWAFHESCQPSFMQLLQAQMPISEAERKYFWPLGPRPDDHPSASPSSAAGPSLRGACPWECHSP